jgi:predicted RNA-binding protein
VTTHVFIVDLVTFKYHLEHLFAGTGAKNFKVDFNNSTISHLKANRENLLVGMIADANRVREGDLIIFYVQRNVNKKIYEGKFYGIFKAKQDWSFLDNNDSKQYLKNELGKSLTFRTLIEPYIVYPEGVTEWEALDEIKHIRSPYQMLWSLIYRKLKGNRGNTMITIYESEQLCKLMRNKNKRNELVIDKKSFSFDSNTQRILKTDVLTRKYKGRQEEIKIFPRLKKKYTDGKSFESHLQSYIVRNIGKGINKSLDILLPVKCSIEWIGNEVSCGVGMQRIDVMLSLIDKGQRIVIPIELKACNPRENNVIQIQRYIDWIEQYYIPNRQSDIQPVLIAEKTNPNSAKFKRVLQSFNDFNELNKHRCKSLKYMEFEVTDNSIDFEIVNYS